MGSTAQGSPGCGEAVWPHTGSHAWWRCGGDVGRRHRAVGHGGTGETLSTVDAGVARRHFQRGSRKQTRSVFRKQTSAPSEVGTHLTYFLQGSWCF